MIPLVVSIAAVGLLFIICGWRPWRGYIKDRDPDVCDGRFRYKSEQEATDGRSPWTTAVYQCAICDGWHLYEP